MNIWSHSKLLCAIGATVLSMQMLAPPASAHDTPIQSSQIAEPGSNVDWGRAETVIQAPLGNVLTVVQDYANYREFVPNFTNSRVLSSRGQSALCYFEASVLRGAATFWVQMRMATREEGNKRIVEARMLKGNVDAFRARWELSPTPEGHTRVVFQVLIAPDLPFPSSIFTGENVKSARRTLRGLRARTQGANAAATAVAMASDE